MNIRHGDLALIAIEKLPEGLTETRTKTIMTGSGGNDHFIDKGKLYLKSVSQFVIGYLIAKSTTLYHPEHGEQKKGEALRKVSIPDGIYELRKQCEFVNDEIKPVVD